MAAGDYDLNFGDNGRAVIQGIGAGSAVVVQADGKSIVAGNSFNGLNPLDFVVARYRSSGLPDRTFGDNGVVIVSAVKRLGYTGEDNNSLGVERFTCVALRDNGKIVVGGYGRGGLTPAAFQDLGLIFQLNADGSVDSSFGQNGVVDVRLSEGQPLLIDDLKLDDQDRIVFLGGGAVGRLTPGGAIDPTFNGGSGPKLIHFDFPTGQTFGGTVLGLQPDDKIVIGGQANSPTGSNPTDFALARLLPDGTPDESFGDSGFVATPVGEPLGFDRSFDSIQALVIAPDGRIWAAGMANTVVSTVVEGLVWAFARYLPDGSLDRGFRQQGVGYTDFLNGPETSFAWDITLQPDGKAVVGGMSENHVVVARLNADDGELDETFARGDGFKYIDFSDRSVSPAPSGVAILPDGDILAAGPPYFGLARLKGDSPQPGVAGVWAAGSGWSSSFRQRLEADGKGYKALGYRLPVSTSQQQPLPWTNLDTFAFQLEAPSAAAVAAGGVAVFSGDERLAIQSVQVSQEDPSRLIVRLAAPLRVGEARLVFHGARNAAGETFSVTIPVLPGDVNQSGGVIDASDLVKIRNALGRSATGSASYDVFSDLNGDGVVNAADLVRIRNLIGAALPGPTKFDYPDFSDVSGLQFFGTVQQVQNLIRLVPASAHHSGAIRLGGVRSLGAGFSTKFTFRYARVGGIPDLDGNFGTDGIAFTIQPPGAGMPVIAGAGVSVLFDAFRDGFDVSSSRVAIYVNGGQVAQFDAEALGFRFRSGDSLAAQIDYDGATLSVRLNGQAIGAVPIQLGSSALLGFAGFAGQAYADQELLSWSSQPKSSPAALFASASRIAPPLRPTLDLKEKRDHDVEAALI